MKESNKDRAKRLAKEKAAQEAATKCPSICGCHEPKAEPLLSKQPAPKMVIKKAPVERDWTKWYWIGGIALVIILTILV